MKRNLAFLAILSSGPVAANEDIIASSYLCDRGVQISAVYVNAGQGGVVLAVEGGQFLLLQEPAGSGVRYGWPSGGSHYVWLSKGAEATLLWHDGETGEETTIYAECRAKE